MSALKLVLSGLLLIFVLSCKPPEQSNLSSETSLQGAWKTVNSLQTKRQSGAVLSYSDLAALMDVITSRYIIQAHERHKLYNHLQEMRIANITHSMRTYMLGKEFGEHAIDRKETVFDIAKKLLIDAVINTPSSEVARAFDDNISKLPPDTELQAVYALVPRVLPKREHVNPPGSYRPKELTPEEYIGTQRWWANQPISVQKALSGLDEKSYLKIVLTLSGRERKSVNEDLDSVYNFSQAINLDNTDIGKHLGPLTDKIDGLAKEKFGEKNIGISVFDLVSFVWNALNKTQKSKITAIAYEFRDPNRTLKNLLTEGNRYPNVKGIINDAKALLDINLSSFDPKRKDQSRWSDNVHYAVESAARAKRNDQAISYQEAQKNQTALYYYLNLNIDLNRRAIAERVMRDWKDRNRTTPEQVLGVFAGFAKSGKGLFWDLPKHGLYKPIVEGDTKFYQSIGYVASNPDVMASLLINQIDNIDKNLPEKTGGLIFDIGLTLLTLPTGGSGGAAFRVLDKFEDFELDKARRVTAKLETLAAKSSAKLQNAGIFSSRLQKKAQQLGDLAKQARYRLQKMESKKAVESLDEMAKAARAGGDTKLADELAAIATRLRGGKAADAATDLASLRAKYGGKLPGQADDLLQEAVQACKVLSLVNSKFACTIPGPNGKKISPHEDAIIYKGVFAAKEARRTLLQAKNVHHGHKHLKATSTSTAKELAKMTAGGNPAQYLYKFRAGYKNFNLEKAAVISGTVTKKTNSVKYWIYRAKEALGFSEGQATNWMRVEMASGNIIHGHPRDLATIARDIAGDTADLIRLELAIKYGSQLTKEEINALNLGPFIKQAANGG